MSGEYAVRFVSGVRVAVAGRGAGDRGGTRRSQAPLLTIVDRMPSYLVTMGVSATLPPTDSALIARWLEGDQPSADAGLLGVGAVAGSLVHNAN